MVGSDPVKKDTPHHIGNRSFVNGKSDVFLLMWSINTFYGSVELGVEAANASAVSINALEAAR
ncbi:MAG TPA: hypothetical protein VL127_12525 [Bryobacteraceae bacterium]|jgi:hypothetical protein|nr:hypothetical protein [Bryobacteraceae bacterium]